MRRTRANLIGAEAPPLEPPASVPELLARVAPGVRVRVFHTDGDLRRATSGTVVSLRDGVLTVTPLEGGCPLRVATDAISCMYLPDEISPRS